jgi:hypothetical protein
MIAPDLTHAHFAASSYSSGQGECVEVAFTPGMVHARDGKDPHGPVLSFTPDQWQGFIRAVSAREPRP